MIFFPSVATNTHIYTNHSKCVFVCWIIAILTISTLFLLVLLFITLLRFAFVSSHAYIHHTIMEKKVNGVVIAVGVLIEMRKFKIWWLRIGSWFLFPFKCVRLLCIVTAASVHFCNFWLLNFMHTISISRGQPVCHNHYIHFCVYQQGYFGRICFFGCCCSSVFLFHHFKSICKYFSSANRLFRSVVFICCSCCQ